MIFIHILLKFAFSKQIIQTPSDRQALTVYLCFSGPELPNKTMNVSWSYLFGSKLP